MSSSKGMLFLGVLGACLSKNHIGFISLQRASQVHQLGDIVGCPWIPLNSEGYKHSSQTYQHTCHVCVCVSENGIVQNIMAYVHCSQVQSAIWKKNIAYH